MASSMLSTSAAPPSLSLTQTRIGRSPFGNRPPTTRISPPKRGKTGVCANLGGSEADAKSAKKKKFITREEEPEQYWQTAGEREGENPMKTPLPYIILFGMSTPFVILAIAFVNGWIKVPANNTCEE